MREAGLPLILGRPVAGGKVENMDRTVNIIHRQEIFKRFVFRIDELKLQHERFDGTMSAEITRLVLNRGR